MAGFGDELFDVFEENAESVTEPSNDKKDEPEPSVKSDSQRYWNSTYSSSKSKTRLFSKFKKNKIKKERRENTK